MELRDVQIMNAGVQACKGKECKFTDHMEDREFVGTVNRIYVSHNEEAKEVRLWVSATESVTNEINMLLFSMPEDVCFCLSSNRSITFRDGNFKPLLEIEL